MRKSWIVGLILIVLIGTIVIIFGMRRSEVTLSMEEMIDRIEQYQRYSITDQVTLGDGTTILRYGNYAEQGALFVTHLPNGNVRYEYTDNEHIYAVVATRDLNTSSDKRSLLVSERVEAIRISSLRKIAHD